MHDIEHCLFQENKNEKARELCLIRIERYIFDTTDLFGGASSGHFAPVGKYDAATDRVLIMDPDRESFDPFWVPADLFLRSMSGIDSDSGLPRGYLIVHLK